MSIEFSPQAKHDLYELADEIRVSSGKFVAHRFAERVTKTLQLLERILISGELIEPGYFSLPGMRAMTIRQYPKHVIFFQPTPDGVYIVRMLYGTRDLDALFGS